MELIFEIFRKKIRDAFDLLQDSIKSLIHWFSSSSGTMDFQTSIICAIVFVVSALVVYLISVFGMRERTYEEAIEEQRQRNKEAIQQAKSDKTKKEKKFKKWGKKGRGKVDDKSIVCAEIEEKADYEAEFIGVEGETSMASLDQKSKCFVSRRKIKLTALVSNSKEDAISQMPSSSEENDEQQSTSRSSSSSPQKDEFVAVAMPKAFKGQVNYIQESFAEQNDRKPIDSESVDKRFSGAFANNDCTLSTATQSLSNQKEDKSSSYTLSDTQIEFNRKLISAIKAARLSTNDVSEIRRVLTCKELSPSLMVRNSAHIKLFVKCFAKLEASYFAVT